MATSRSAFVRLTEDETNVLWSFICPISLAPFKEPVATRQGKIYEKKEIEKWFQNHNTDPISLEVLPDKTLIPLPKLAVAINEYSEIIIEIEKVWRKDRNELKKLKTLLGEKQNQIIELDEQLKCSSHVVQAQQDLMEDVLQAQDIDKAKQENPLKNKKNRCCVRLFDKEPDAPNGAAIPEDKHKNRRSCSSLFSW